MHVAHSELSLDDFLAMPDEKLVEWHRGRLEHKPMPSKLHARVQGGLILLLGNWSIQTGAGHVMPEVRITVTTGDDPRSILPDVSFESAGRSAGPPRDESMSEAPDLTIEVVSRGQGFGYYQERVTWLLSHGSRLVWVVDGRERTVTVFKNGILPEVRRGTTRLGDPEVLRGFDATVDDLWKWSGLSSEAEEQPA